MKTVALDPGNLDDLIFENRNKDYGAYYIRKSYSKNMMTGLGFSVSLACLLVILPQLLSLFGKESTILPLIKEPLGKDVVFDHPPLVQPPVQVTPPPSAPRHSVNHDLPPQVTTKPVDDVIQPNTNTTPANDGPSTGTGENDITPFTETGGGDMVASLPAEPTSPVNFAEVMPEYDGGVQAMMKFIVKHTHFPSSARRLGTQGIVYVSFVVDREGNVVEVKVARGISADCDKEAVRVISMMRGWKAGMQNHRPVSVRMTLPINFKLHEI